MNVGVVLPTYLDLGVRRELICAAEDLGIHALFIGESANSNLFVDLALAATETETVRLGAAIANVFSRSPSVIALGAAHLDAVADGRLTLGLGTSTPELVEGVHGIPFGRPVARIDEYIDIIRAGWSGERLDYDGDFYSPEGGRLRQTPTQDRLPIAVAALGPKNRELTGRKADVWLPHLVPRSVLPDMAADVRAAAEDANRSADDVEVAVYVPTAVGADVEAQRTRIRSHIAAYAGAAVPYRNVVAAAGYESAAEGIYEAWQAGDREAARTHVTDDLVDDFGIAASPDDAAARAAQWAECGVDTLLMHFPPGTTAADVRRAARAVA